MSNNIYTRPVKTTGGLKLSTDDKTAAPAKKKSTTPAKTTSADSFEAKTTRDPASGQATGKRSHNPMRAR